jgi:hypothetical protein
MRLRLAVIALVGAAVVIPAAGAKLTPAEQTWVSPLLKIWNTQYAAGGLVIPEANAKGGLTAGTKANEKLVGTLAALIDCKAPKDKIKAAGDPPTARLATFQTELNAACKLDYQGAKLFATAVGDVRQGKISVANAHLKSGVTDLRNGRVQLANAYEYLTKIGK